MKNMYLAGLALIVSMSAVACAAQPGEGEEGSTHGHLKPAPNPNPGPAPAPEPPAPDPTPGPLCSPLAGPGGGPGIGLANPASVYCEAQGGNTDDESCTFADGTSCEQWAFYRGECGEAHSFCNQNGGQVSTKTENQGGFTATFAVCTLPSGVSCNEQDFAATCICE
jgi:putative hemolysin